MQVNRLGRSAVGATGVVVAGLVGALVLKASALGQPASPAAGGATGAATYAANCVACHQENGAGVAGGFPPLAGHVPELLGRPGGREYLPRLVLVGLDGPITVKGQAFDGVMPPWNQLSDAEIAAVLNHVATAWGNDKALPADFKPFAASEIAAARSKELGTEQVRALRLAVLPDAKALVGDGAAASATPPLFTTAQAERGQAAYAKNCLDCHGSNLDDGEFGGAPLKGSYFRQRWGNGSVSALFAYAKSKMPPDRPGRLSDQTYADIVAFFLKANGYKAGDKVLPSDPAEQQAMSMKQ